MVLLVIFLSIIGKIATETEGCCDFKPYEGCAQIVEEFNAKCENENVRKNKLGETTTYECVGNLVFYTKAPGNKTIIGYEKVRCNGGCAVVGTFQEKEYDLPNNFRYFCASAKLSESETESPTETINILSPTMYLQRTSGEDRIPKTQASTSTKSNSTKTRTFRRSGTSEDVISIQSNVNKEQLVRRAKRALGDPTTEEDCETTTPVITTFEENCETTPPVTTTTEEDCETTPLEITTTEEDCETTTPESTTTEEDCETTTPETTTTEEDCETTTPETTTTEEDCETTTPESTTTEEDCETTTPETTTTDEDCETTTPETTTTEEDCETTTQESTTTEEDCETTTPETTTTEEDCETTTLETTTTEETTVPDTTTTVPDTTTTVPETTTTVPDTTTIVPDTTTTVPETTTTVPDTTTTVPDTTTTSAAPVCCVMGGVWTEWSSGGPCSDTCGLCGTTTRTRKCTSMDQGCPCAGKNKKEEPCGETPCLFPRSTCCGNYTKMALDGRFQCGPQGDPEPPASDVCYTCCPKSNGVWSEWSKGTPCADSCGSCAKTRQRRVCLTEPHGCPCHGAAVRERNCNIGVCYYPRLSCCAPYEAMVINKTHACGPQPTYVDPAPLPYDCDKCCPLYGEWSEWTVIEGCPDYCGNTGTRKKIRTCRSDAIGCPCVGESTLEERCNIGVCYYPRLSCYPGFTAQVINSTHACGPVINAVVENPYVNTCGKVCCPNKGIWGEWTVSVPCNDTCGACGMEQRSRVCLSEQYGCGCTGSSTTTEVCGTTVCLFPRGTCCAPYTKQVDSVAKKFVCGPVGMTPQSRIENTTCCDPEKKGLWNQWSQWSTCSSDCGLCGTRSRIRTCASAAYGCPCEGNDKHSQACGNPLCAGNKPCCQGKIAVGYDGMQFCKNEPTGKCAGEWTDWDTKSICNDTCGMNGRIPQYRYCLPANCQCTGPFTQLAACGEDVCLFPRSTCGPGFKKAVKAGEKKFVCVPV